jgi:cobalamin biosynthesis Mg chelatase CobN
MRPKASFCHSCGHSLNDFKGGKVPPPAPAQTQELNAEMLKTGNETVIVESEPLVETVLERTNGATTVIIEETSDVEAKPEIVEPHSETIATPAPAAPKKKVRKTKRYVAQSEYIWEESDAPNWSILIVSVLSLVLVVVLLWLGNFWR